MRRWIDDHGLSLVLASLFLISWVGQFGFQAIEVSNDAVEHGSAFSWSDYWPAFWSATFENWQSEFLQLFSFVILSTYLIHRSSPQSRDGDDEMKLMLERIEQKLS